MESPAACLLLFCSCWGVVVVVVVFGALRRAFCLRALCCYFCFIVVCTPIVSTIIVTILIVVNVVAMAKFNFQLHFRRLQFNFGKFRPSVDFFVSSLP